MEEEWVAGVWDEEGSGSAFSNFTEEDNLTLTCAARNIQGPIELPYSSTLTITVRVIQSLYCLFIILAGSFLNTVVIILVAKYKKLQNLSFLVSLQVMAINLMWSVSILPGLVTVIADKWLFGEYVCAIAGWILTTTTITRTLLMCVFVIDRYLAVAWPYFYPKYKFKVTVTLSVASWVFSVLMNSAMLPWFLDCYTFASISKMCVSSFRCNHSCSIFVRIFTAILVPLIILPVVLYTILYCKSRNIRRSTSSEAIGTIKNEWKATITFSLLFLTLFALTVPIMSINIILSAFLRGDNGEYPPAAYPIVVINSSLVFLLIITDPVVIMRDKDVKEVLKEIKDSFCVRAKNNTTGPAIEEVY